MESPHEAPRVDDIISKTEEILAQATERSVEKLRPFVALQPDEGEIFACFELFHGQEDYGLGYNKFFPKEPDSFNSLDVVRGPMDASDESFLPELQNYGEDFFSTTELTKQEGIDWAKKSGALLTKWFSECWKAAGGNESIIPTYFCLENEDKCRDMFSGEIISEEEAARRAGYTVT